MNKRKSLIIIFIILATALGITGTVVFFRVPYTTLTYTESDEIITNPSRGFYVQFDSGHLQKLYELDGSGITLVLLAYDIQDFTDRDLSQAKLDELSLAFDAIRAHGLKVIFRAAYGFSRNAEYSDPSSLNIIKTHISQISPILIENKDLLLTVQAGFLGPWGEWHHSNLGDDQGTPTQAIINELLAALCEAVPQTVSIAVRRPRFIRLIDTSIVDISRIAFHNDALLSTDTDMGSYDQAEYTRNDELTYIHERPYPVANGGEMPMLSMYTEPSVAFEELSLLKLTYLNHEYNKEVIAYWETVNTENKPFIDLIQKKLGYRYFIEKSIIPKSFRTDQSVKIKVTLKNSGFSAVTIPYRIELIVHDESGVRKIIPFEGINLQTLNSEQTLTMTVLMNLSELSHKFTLGLRIVERDMTQIMDERTLIRLANEGLTMKDGITFFASYDWDGKKYTLSSSVREQ